MNIKIAPSILTSKVYELGSVIKELEQAGVDYLHMDVMDGVFVPNITFGHKFVADIKEMTQLPLDVHLMIVEPEKHIENFAKAGASIISVHVEGNAHVNRLLQMIKGFGVKCGVVLNPHTPVCYLENVIDIVDYILIMTVNPGFGGQKFIESSIQKIERVRAMIGERNITLAVDGGINKDTAPSVIKAGADFLVAGTAIVEASDKNLAVKTLRQFD